MCKLDVLKFYGYVVGDQSVTMSSSPSSNNPHPSSISAQMQIAANTPALSYNALSTSPTERHDIQSRNTNCSRCRCRNCTHSNCCRNAINQNHSASPTHTTYTNSTNVIVVPHQIANSESNSDETITNLVPQTQLQSMTTASHQITDV